MEKKTLRKNCLEECIFAIKMWWKQLWCRHQDTGIHSYPFTHPRGNSIRYGIWQRRVCLTCGKVIEEGHAWKTNLSENRMKLIMRRLGHEAKAFSIKRSIERSHMSGM